MGVVEGVNLGESCFLTKKRGGKFSRGGGQVAVQSPSKEPHTLQHACNEPKLKHRKILNVLIFISIQMIILIFILIVIHDNCLRKITLRVNYGNLLLAVKSHRGAR